MDYKDTEKTTQNILNRMGTTLENMEQMSFDSINITDRLVTLVGETREHASAMKQGTVEERKKHYEIIAEKLNQILDTAFQVNNVSHELEKETVYQRETTDQIRQIIEFLYAMSE